MARAPWSSERTRGRGCHVCGRGSAWALLWLRVQAIVPVSYLSIKSLPPPVSSTQLYREAPDGRRLVGDCSSESRMFTLLAGLPHGPEARRWRVERRHRDAPDISRRGGGYPLIRRRHHCVWEGYVCILKKVVNILDLENGKA